MTSDSHEQSLRTFFELREKELKDERLDPRLNSILLDHGHKTQRAIVFVHGLTSSPPQFFQLGQQFFQRGYNVLIPRLPRHGQKDPLNTDHAQLNVQELKKFADQTVCVGSGLGEQLSYAGLSVSGVIAAWCAQHRAEIDLAVLLAPAFAPAGVPTRLVPLLARLALGLPNVLVWWDMKLRARLVSPYGYPRFSTHALASAYMLGTEVFRAADKQKPSARSILVVTNSLDLAVGNNVTAALVRRWRERGATVKTHEFRTELARLHDFIGPYQPGARIDLVYPTLLELMGAPPC